MKLPIRTVEHSNLSNLRQKQNQVQNSKKQKASSEGNTKWRVVDFTFTQQSRKQQSVAATSVARGASRDELLKFSELLISPIIKPRRSIYAP